MSQVYINIPEKYKNNSGIYQITNNATGAKYIGSACKLLKRAKEHANKLNNFKHSSKMQADYNTNDFTISILILCDIDNLRLYEELCLSLVRPSIDYNRTLCPSGSSPGRVVSIEVKEHISKIMQGRKLSSETKNKIAASHKALQDTNFREINRAKAVAAVKGIPKSEEHKKKSGLGVHLAALRRKGLINE